MNSITIFREPLHGYLYYKLKGRDYKINVEQGNLFKIDNDSFDGIITNLVPEFSYTEIQTQDGQRSFVLTSTSGAGGGSRVGGGGRRGVNILTQGTLLGLGQSINFTGAGVTVIFSNGQATVNIPDGGAGMIGGGGTLNYIPKFTPDGTHISDSLLFDNGTSVLFGGTTAIPSAGIALTSTTQGFLVPRMTTVQRNAIAAPATGLLIYNTSTSLFSYFDGVTWQNIDSQAGGDVSGSGTTNFITKWTDGPNSVIGDSIVFDDGTSVGVGIAAPLSKLHVAGTIRTGVASTTNGSLIFQNSTNANTLTINSGVTSASYALTLPTAQGAANTLLANDGTGVLSWVSVTSPAWMLDGNTVGAEKWIGTIDNFNFPIRTNNTVRGLVDNGGLWAIGSSSTTAGARLAITGTGTTSATYAIRTYNSTPTEIFSVRNDGYIYAGVGTSMTVGLGSKFDNTLAGNIVFAINYGEFTTPSGTNNTIMGLSAGHDLTTGSLNTFMGRLAGSGVNTGSNNVLIGASAGSAQGDNRVFIGANAGNINANASVAIGYAALGGTGATNTIIGNNSFGKFNNSGADNSTLGEATLQRLDSGSRNVAIGSGSGAYVFLAASDNTYVGSLAGQLNNDTGTIAGTLARSKNTFIGSASGQVNRGNNGVGLGYYAAHYETADNKLFIDAIDRTTEALSQTLGLIYGLFAATTASQFVRVNANLGILTNTFGTNADGVLGLANGTAPTTSPADMVQLFSVDLSAGNASLGIRTETAVVTEAVISDRTLSVTINGTIYKICLKV